MEHYVSSLLQHGNTRRLRQLAQETEALPQDEEVGWNIIPLFLTFRLIALLQGEGASLISRLLAAKQQVIEAGDFLATIRVISWLALAYTQAAQLHQAKRECLEGLRLAEYIGGRTFFITSVERSLGVAGHFQVPVSRKRRSCFLADDQFPRDGSNACGRGCLKSAPLASRVPHQLQGSMCLRNHARRPSTSRPQQANRVSRLNTAIPNGSIVSFLV